MSEAMRLGTNLRIQKHLFQLIITQRLERDRLQKRATEVFSETTNRNLSLEKKKPTQDLCGKFRPKPVDKPKYDH